jgi:hypothetical protein
MSSTITARDLWPLVRKMPQAEQVRLARLVMEATSTGDIPDSRAYQASPPDADEFSTEDDPLAWEGEGWEEFYAAR